MVTNPILRGFNPDPSFLRVGDDYYIAVSTFEWYPGVQIYHSTDLANWVLVARPLNRADLLDMRGNPDSCGVWAPCLSYANGKFWLVYTDVKRFDGAFKDAHNYITTCETIDGDWSARKYVNSSGFDPSLFHDEDGRKWFLNMRWNHRGPGTGMNPAQDAFDGIELQQWDPELGLIGPVHDIYAGTDLGLTEAPHLFKRAGRYYLTVAEGGTGYDHAVTMARATDICGPYETHPQKHVMTTRFDPAHGLQRVGHGQMIETAQGEVYHSFLCGRPIAGANVCPMGRETGIARCAWGKDDWLYLIDGGVVPPVDLPLNAAALPPKMVWSDIFTTPTLPAEFQWLRTPHPDRIFSMTGTALRMTGRESIGSWFEQSLVARRQQEASYQAQTCVVAAPVNWQTAAGLVTYYNRHKFHAALITHQAGVGRVLTVVSCLGDWPGEALTISVQAQPVPQGALRLKVVVDGISQQFLWASEGADFIPLGPILDASLISDEGGRGEHASFTGAFVGMFAMDLTGQGWSADFLAFEYQNMV